MRTHVDLFSGIGGFSLACEWAAVETIAFSETDSYASKVLRRHWPHVRNHGDVREFPSLSAWLLTAGVPCQPASIAGKRKGAADDRWLWPQTLAVVANGSYEWLLFENPTGILSLNDGLEFERICTALEDQDYEVQPLIIPACGVGALHRRNRVWIVAHTRRERWERGRPGMRQEADREVFDLRFTDGGETLADTNGRRRQQRDEGERSVSVAQSRRDVSNSEPARLEGNERGELAQPGEGRFDANITGSTWWSVEPDVGRLANGVSDRVGKLRCLGNAIVPQVAYQLIKRMIESEEILNES